MDNYPSLNRYYANGSREYMDMYSLTLKGKTALNKNSLSNKKINIYQIHYIKSKICITI